MRLAGFYAYRLMLRLLSRWKNELGAGFTKSI